MTILHIADVPFHSQIREISSKTWQQQGCGITSLAMIIDFYTDTPVSVNTLLGQGIAAGAYIHNVGWSYAGLIKVAKRYRLQGASYDLAKSSSSSAFEQLAVKLDAGPVIASVHYKFDPISPLPHLVVLTGIKDDIVYYNDPAAKAGEQQISKAAFMQGWKKRMIVIRPA